MVPPCPVHRRLTTCPIAGVQRRRSGLGACRRTVAPSRRGLTARRRQSPVVVGHRLLTIAPLRACQHVGRHSGTRVSHCPPVPRSRRGLTADRRVSAWCPLPTRTQNRSARSCCGGGVGLAPSRATRLPRCGGALLGALPGQALDRPRKEYIDYLCKSCSLCARCMASRGRSRACVPRARVAPVGARGRVPCAVLPRSRWSAPEKLLTIAPLAWH